MKKDNDKPTKLCIYVYPQQYAQLCELSQRAGRSQSAIIRMMLDMVPIREVPPADYCALLAELRKIGVNINQLAHHANATGRINPAHFHELTAQLNQALLDIRRAVELA